MVSEIFIEHLAPRYPYYGSTLPLNVLIFFSRCTNTTASICECTLSSQRQNPLSIGHETIHTIFSLYSPIIPSFLFVPLPFSVMLPVKILTSLLLFINTCALAFSTCWYPDGITSEPNHVPCNQTINSASTCCAPQDACSGGLCVSVYGTYRGSCTDQSWNSPNCAAREWPPCLTDPSTRRRYSHVAPILSCASPGTKGESVCCGYSNGSSCCNDQFRIGNSGPAYIPGFDAVATGLSSIGGTNTTNITTVPSDSSQNIGTMVGLGVGIPLGFLVAGLIGFLFYREYNKNKLILEPTNSKMALAGAGNVISNSPKDPHNLYQNYSNIQNGPPPMESHEPLYHSRNSKPEPVFEVPVSNVHEMRG